MCVKRPLAGCNVPALPGHASRFARGLTGFASAVTDRRGRSVSRRAAGGARRRFEAADGLAEQWDEAVQKEQTFNWQISAKQAEQTEISTTDYHNLSTVTDNYVMQKNVSRSRRLNEMILLLAIQIYTLDRARP